MSESLNAQKLQAMLDDATGGGTTQGSNPMLPYIQAQSTIYLCALLEHQLATATARGPSVSAGKAAVQASAKLRETALQALAPFYKAMKVNEKAGGKLKPEMAVMQIGEFIITGEDIKRAADAYDELWQSR